MPRRADYEGRRRRIADAICRLADECGLEGVTLRDVAARAEVSMGAVQRCFSTKEQMLVFALDHISERVRGRARARLAESPAQSARTALGHAVTEMSLLREENRAEARVWLAFVAQAAVNPALSEVLRAHHAGFQEAVAGLIGEASDTGDAHGAARIVLALADGLTTHVIIGHLTREAALDALDTHLHTLWYGAPAS